MDYNDGDDDERQSKPVRYWICCVQDPLCRRGGRHSGVQHHTLEAVVAHMPLVHVIVVDALRNSNGKSEAARRTHRHTTTVEH